MKGRLLVTVEEKQIEKPQLESIFISDTIKMTWCVLTEVPGAQMDHGSGQHYYLCIIRFFIILHHTNATMPF